MFARTELDAGVLLADLVALLVGEEQEASSWVSLAGKAVL
jgi:hypothetical protein